MALAIPNGALALPNGAVAPTGARGNPNRANLSLERGFGAALAIVPRAMYKYLRDPDTTNANAILS
jgi:hypothetical protein